MFSRVCWGPSQASGPLSLQGTRSAHSPLWVSGFPWNTRALSCLRCVAGWECQGLTPFYPPLSISRPATGRRGIQIAQLPCSSSGISLRCGCCTISQKSTAWLSSAHAWWNKLDNYPLLGCFPSLNYIPTHHLPVFPRITSQINRLYWKLCLREALSEGSRTKILGKWVWILPSGQQEAVEVLTKPQLLASAELCSTPCLSSLC